MLYKRFFSVPLSQYKTITRNTFLPCDTLARFWVMATPYGASRSLTGHTTLGRTPLDERSARRRELYLTTNNNHTRDKHPCPRRDVKYHYHNTKQRTRTNMYWNINAYFQDTDLPGCFVGWKVCTLHICQPAKRQCCRSRGFRSCYLSNLTRLDDRR